METTVSLLIVCPVGKLWCRVRGAVVCATFRQAEHVNGWMPCRYALYRAGMWPVLAICLSRTSGDWFNVI